MICDCAIKWFIVLYTSRYVIFNHHQRISFVELHAIKRFTTPKRTAPLGIYRIWRRFYYLCIYSPGASLMVVRIPKQ